MDVRQVPPRVDCGAGHDEHLCYMISQGFHLADQGGFRALIDEPRFECRHCRRTARNAENLCIPVEL